MKKYLFSLLFLAMAFSSATLHAQAPRAVTQQAVVRDAAGHLLSGRAITLRVSIMQGSPAASPIFVETHSATTNANGLYTILVGQGTAVFGTFAAIDWGSGPFYASTDIDPDGGTNYSITTTQQFLSVPFALFADTAAHVALASVAASATTAQHATLSDTARYYQERQVLSLGHDTIFLTGGSYIVLPSSGNANISSTYIDSVIRANNTTVVNNYVDSVIRANNTTVVNNYVDSVVRANNTVVQNQISDSVRQMQNVVNNNITTLLRDSITTLLRDSIVTIIRDSSTVIQQNISTIPAGACYATCGRVDSLIRRLDSTIHVYDSTIHVYDSLSRRLAHRIDSVDSVSTANPCLGHSYAGSISHTACDSYTWLANGQTYTTSTTASKTFTGGSAAGCDSTVTLHLTINHGTHNAETQSATTSYTWHGNTYTASGNYVYTYTNASGCPSADTLHLTISSGSVVITDGALPGTFSVSSTTSVKFSQGNLQYQASTNTWRFAEHQYDYIGNASGNTTATASRATQSAWIDLFGWGTSGYHDPADNYNQRYQPWETASSTVDGDYNSYGYGPSTNQASRNLTGTSAHYDWGVHNAISNGGNVAGRWRTLTCSEWGYLLNTRTTTGTIGGTSNARFCKATVDGNAGMIIFPDNYTHPTGIPIPNNTNSSSAGYSDTFTESEWSRMEAAGCVFLPAAGYRSGTTVSSAGSCGYYWSSTYFISYNAFHLYFYSSNMNAQNLDGYRFNGRSVRLVQDENNPISCSGTHNVETQSAIDSYTWHGNTYTASGNYVYTYTNASGCPSADTLHLTISSGSVVITDGALPGTFSVSSTTSVKFSQGNLQYQASTNTWRFAEHQYDYIGNASGNTTATASRDTQSAWIDLFGWGTSGYHDPADYYNQRYQPWETASSTVDGTYNSYGYGPSTNQASRNLTGTSAHYDWGVHNAISNGGNVAGRWRTLTSSEWDYLLNTRRTTGVIRGTSNARFCKATVDGNAGMIIFPDNYTHPTGIPIPNNTNSSNAGYSDTFTESEWSRMEAAGCVFLPAAGYRYGATVGVAGSRGYYWSSAYDSSYLAYGLLFYSSGMNAQGIDSRYYGRSVRLVQGL